MMPIAVQSARHENRMIVLRNLAIIRPELSTENVGNEGKYGSIKSSSAQIGIKSGKPIDIRLL